MRRECGAETVARPGAARRALVAAARWLAAGALSAAGAAFAAGCGISAPGTLRPGGPAGTGGLTGNGRPAGTGGAAAGPAVAWPPFGRNVHIVMPGWLPADSAEIPAVITAKDFLLAVLYAEYRGNQDDRWTGYATGAAAAVQRSILAQPDVTTQSFTGTVTFSHFTAFPDPAVSGAVDVSECFGNSLSANISLSTGKVLPDQVPANRHHYRNTDVVARRNGRWQVISMYPVRYYPQARECRP